jgi:hypothetical protein
MLNIGSATICWMRVWVKVRVRVRVSVRVRVMKSA